MGTELSECALKEKTRCRDDYEYFAKGYLKVKAKSGKSVPLVFKRAQRIVHEKAEEQLRTTGKVRMIILKYRQGGISSYIQGRVYHKTTHTLGLSAFIITHEDKATKNLFNITKRFYDNIENPYMKPRKGASSAKELTFPAMDSSYQVATAGTKEVGRSHTAQLFHGSEVAFWANADLHAAGIGETVGDEPGTEMFLESTACGIGNWFFNAWYDAKRGRSDYIAVFLGWNLEEAYRVPAPHDFVRTSSDDNEFENEVVLAEEYGLDNDQLMWRRQKIIKLGLDLFKQEYPINDDEAFRYSGKTFFQKSKIDLMRHRAKEPLYRGTLEQVGDDIRFTHDPDGDIEVWEMPRKGESYVCGVDVSEGKELDGAKNDQHSINIVRRGDRPVQVARAAPNIGPDELGRLGVLMCLWYNYAVIGPERNNMGLATVIAIQDTGYENVYMMHEAEADNEKGDKESSKPGWHTNIATRGVLCNDLRQAIREGTIIVNSEISIGQFGTFVRNRQGKPEAASGCLDDEVFSLGICLQLIKRTDPDDYMTEEQMRAAFRGLYGGEPTMCPQMPLHGRGGSSSGGWQGA